MIHAEYVGALDQVLTFEKAARKLPRARVLAGGSGARHRWREPGRDLGI